MYPCPQANEPTIKHEQAVTLKGNYGWMEVERRWTGRVGWYFLRWESVSVLCLHAFGGGGGGWVGPENFPGGGAVLAE